jgi:hypothetical protein
MMIVSIIEASTFASETRLTTKASRWYAIAPVGVTQQASPTYLLRVRVFHPARIID